MVRAVLEAFLFYQLVEVVDCLQCAIRFLAQSLTVFDNTLNAFTILDRPIMEGETVAGRCFPFGVSLFEFLGIRLPVETDIIIIMIICHRSHDGDEKGQEENRDGVAEHVNTDCWQK